VATGTPAQTSLRFAQAINEGDLAGALACWSPDAVIVSETVEEARGHQALRERFGQLIDTGARVEIVVSDEICTELAATANTQMTLTLPGGSDPLRLKGAVVYVPGVDGWQILIDRLAPAWR
jgi:ketosteroid isomerase-like protein